MALPQALARAELPPDAVEVGRVQGAWGVQGGLRLQAHSADPAVLLKVRQWFLCPPQGRHARPASAFDAPVSVQVRQCRVHADGLVAVLEGLDDRDAAEALKGATIHVSRQAFPAPRSPDEYYWVDLIGLSVVNREGVALGTVRDLLPTGPHAVLCLEADGEPGSDGQPARIERLIPFVSAYVDAVDLPARRITVDWQPDY